MNTFKRLAIAVALAALPLRVSAALSVVDAAGGDDFILAAKGEVVPILVEASAGRAVARAANDLLADIERVSGVKAEVIADSTGKKTLIIVGVLGQSKILDALVADNRLDVTGVRGEWESHVSQLVANPLPGVARALVIAGSDRRGAIYGCYELSELIGVSPWNWWADVPVKTRKVLALRGDGIRQGPPAVKYRGIFLNDEDFGLRPWAAKTFEPEVGNIGPKTYAKVFELLLRLRANLLWPAMHEGTAAFNSNPTNRELADAYGVVMGSSHCEQMLRNNISEWDTNKFGEYNYVVNRDGVLKYWEQRVRENAKFENLFTRGMRGIHDSGMPGGGEIIEQAQRLHQIITDQRELLARHVSTNLERVPQIFCPYKEVLALYRAAPNIPDDITLVWPDDNYGYVRQFSDDRERARSGGAGVYYHASYWGAPCDYLWLESTPPALIREEMAKAWDYGASNVWVLNVGDIKPGEIATEFFLKLAWNPHRWSVTNVNDALTEMAARDFGAENAKEIGDILVEYYRLNFQRKPEHMGFDLRSGPFTKPFFSVSANGDENLKRLDAWRSLVARTHAAEKQLPPESRAAFYQLVGYRVRAAALMNEKALNFTRYFSFGGQGRAGTEEFLTQARRAQEAIQDETKNYNELAGGKWRGMMSANPRNLAVFGMPTTFPPIAPAGAVFSVAAEGNHIAAAVDGDELPARVLPQFNRLTRRTFYIDVFHLSDTPSSWAVTNCPDWIRLSQTFGTNDARLKIDIDWSRAPVGEDVKERVLFVNGRRKIPVAVSVFNPANADAANSADFVEDNHRIVMEAEHAFEFVPGADAKWEVARGLGYNGEAVCISPVTVPVRAEAQKILSESPGLRYKVWLRTAGDWKFTVRALPTWSVVAGQPQRYAIALDDAPPQIVSLPAGRDERDRTWQENVLRNAALTSSVHPVQAGLHTLKIWMVDPGVVIDAIMGEGGAAPDAGYTWPPETRPVRSQK